MINSRTFQLALGAGLGCWLVAGCSSSGDDSYLQSAEKAIAPDGVAQVRTQQLTAAGKRFDHLEGYSPTSARGYEQLVFTSRVTVDLENEAQRGEWDSTTVEVYPGTHGTWTEVSAQGLGYVTGQDGAFPPAGDGAPMLSSRVAARWKELALMTPSFLVRYGLAHPDQVQEVADLDWNGKTYHVVSIASVDGWPAPTRLFLDPVTFLPAKADTLEDDPVYGDTLVEFAYRDWRPAGASLAPFAITEIIAGSVALDETRSAVVDNPPLPSGTFEVRSELQGTFDQGMADYGKRTAAYLLRTQEYGFAGYDEVSKYMQAMPLRSTAGAAILFYNVAGYNSLAVELPSSILVVEAPLYESVASVVIKDIKQRIPGKPIEYLVSTHFHYDHSGGVRTYAAEGAQIIVPIETADYYRAMLDAPHTLRPDALARSPRPALVTGVGDRLSIIEGAQRITLHNLRQSHSDGCLVAFLEDARMLFTSDLYNPGGLGPNPTGPDRPFHDLYARELYAGLTALGITSTTLTTFVGGHSGLGTWDELRLFGGI